MGFGSRLELREETQLKQTCNEVLSIEKEWTLKGICFDRRLELIGSLRNEQPMKVAAKCPQCNHQMTTGQVLAGYTTDVNDIRTTCYLCRHRFEANLVFRQKNKQVTKSMYCDIQVLPKMRGLEGYEPYEYSRENPGVYFSALAHYGTLKAGYRKLDINYRHEEVRQWEKKIGPFLGRLPDCDVADTIGIKPDIVQKLRRELGIKEYNMYEEALSLT